MSPVELKLLTLLKHIFYALLVFKKVRVVDVVTFVITIFAYIFRYLYLFKFGEHMFQQIIDVPMGTNCVPVFVYHFIYSPEAALIRTSIKD